MCEECAFFVNNWVYGYQHYCTLPTEYWINTGGWIIIGIMSIVVFYYSSKIKRK